MKLKILSARKLLGALAFSVALGMDAQDCPTLTLSPATLPNGRVGTNYNQTFYSGSWKNTGSMNVHGFLRTATLLANGKVLVAGGYGAIGGFTVPGISHAELYDPTSNTWTPTQPMIGGRMHHTSILMPNGKVLVVGGGSSHPQKAEIYDPATEIWTLSNPTYSHFYHTATLLTNGTVMIANWGGSEIYNPTTGIWTVVNKPTAVGMFHTATLLPDGKVLAVGGYSNYFNYGSAFSNAEIYDPTTGVWTPTGSLNTPRGHHRATLLPNGKVLVAGGINGGGPNGGAVAVFSAELYDPVTGLWTVTGSMNFQHLWGIGTMLSSGKYLVAGGSGHSRVEQYDPGTESWNIATPLNLVRNEATMAVLADGRILAAGGNANGRFLSSAEVFDPISAGVPPYTFAVSSGSLPDGLSLTSDGTLSGTPTAIGAKSFAVTVTDANGCTGMNIYSISVSCPQVLPNGWYPIPAGSPGMPYNFTNTASGGVGPYIFTANSLPEGLILTPDGVLSGVIVSNANYGNPFVLTATDSRGCSGSQSCSLILPIQVHPDRLLDARRGAPYSSQITANGGLGGPFTFSIAYGELPPGLTFSTNGLLSGTPTELGEYPLIIRATESDDFGVRSGEGNYLLNVTVTADVVSPALVILSPANGASLTNPILTVAGTAKNPGTYASPLEWIMFSLNGSEWDYATADLPLWWAEDLVLKPGTNVFRIRANDEAGNVSIPLTNFYFMETMVPFTIVKNGLGNVSMGSGDLALGGLYTISATPGADYMFSNWVASANGGAPTVSTSNKLTFVMESNLTLTANFVFNPFISAAGKYHALFSETSGVTHQAAGLLAITVRDTLTFGGTLMLDGDKISISGKFNLDGTVTKIISRSKHLKDDLVLTLALDFANDKIIGSVSSTGWTSELEGDKALTAAIADNYTLLLPGFADPTQGPSGYSYGSARRVANGFVKFSGGTADGLALVQSLPLSKYNRLPFYVPLYKSTKVYTNGIINRSYCLGSMFGWIFLTNNTALGTIDWNKTPVAGTLYPNGFSHQATMLGSHYTVPPLSTPSVNFTNGTLTLTNGNLSAPLIRNVLIKTNGAIAITPTVNAAKFAIARTTGLILGNFQHPDNANNVTTIKGAVLQDEDSAGGYFLGINQGGLMLLEGN